MRNPEPAKVHGPQVFETLLNTPSGTALPGARVELTLVPRFCCTTQEDGVSHGLAITLTETLMLHLWRTLDYDGQDLWHITLFDNDRSFSLPMTIESGDALFVNTPDRKFHSFPVGADSQYVP